MTVSLVESDPLIKVHVLLDPISRERGAESKHLWTAGCTVQDFIPEEIRLTLANGGNAYCIVNGLPIEQENWLRYPVEPGDDLTYFVSLEKGSGLDKGIPKFSKNKFINTALRILSVASWFGTWFVSTLYSSFRPSKTGIESPTYNFGKIQTTLKNGTPIAVCYGKHVVGGQYINSFKTVDPKTGKVTLSALIALCEGPIAAIANQSGDVDGLTGTRIPEGIRIGDVEAKDIEGLSVSWRLGYPDQTVIGGFSDTVNNVNVGQIVYAASPVTYNSTTESVEGFSVIITWPNGLIYIGSIVHYVHQQMRIRYQKLSSKNAPAIEANWINYDFIVTNKTSNQFSREIRFDNVDPGFYAIQLVRLQTYDDPAFGGYATQFEFDSVNEITYGDSFSYPNVALLAIKGVAAENFQGDLPNINTEILGKLVYIWTSGLVTAPVFSLLWSDSPAWCALDAFTNPRYGGGTDMTLCDIDLQSFKDWADFCVTQIDIGDGLGTLKERFTCNTVFDTQDRLWDEVQKIGICARGAFVRAGSKIRVKIDQTGNPVQLFTMGNIIRDSFSFSVTSRQEKPNHIDVDYLNEADHWNPDTQTAFDPNISNLYRNDQTRMPCITRSYQAARQAQFFFNQADLISRQVQFSVPVDSLAAEPGDIIAVAHDMPFWGTASGRTFEDAGSTTTIKLDSQVTVPGSGTLQITVRTSGTGVDVFQTRTVSTAPGTYAPGTSLTVSAAWNTSDLPKKGDPWSAATSTTAGFAAKLYRIAEIIRDSDLVTQIKAFEYNAAVYDDDPGFVAEVGGDANPSSNEVPPVVTNLAAEEIDQIQADGTLIIQVNISWVKPEANSPYTNRIYLKLTSQPDIGFGLVGETTDNTFTIGQDYIALGDSYDIAVVSVAGNGVQYTAPEDVPFVSISITGSQAKPPDVSGFAVAQNGNSLVFTWNGVLITNLQGYEIRSGSSWQGGTVIGSDITATTFTTVNYSPNVLNTFWIKAKNTIGNYSQNASSVSITPTIVGTPAIDDQEAPAWAGTKTNFTVQPNGTLKMNGGVILKWNGATFAWNSATAQTTQWNGGAAVYETGVLDAAAIDDYILQIGLSVNEFDSTLKWNTAGFAWNSVTGQNSTWLGTVTDGNHITYTIQISLSTDNVTYSPYSTFIAGQYNFRYLKVRILASSSDPDFLGILNSLHITATPV